MTPLMHLSKKEPAGVRVSVAVPVKAAGSWSAHPRFTGTDTNTATAGPTAFGRDFSGRHAERRGHSTEAGASRLRRGRRETTRRKTSFTGSGSRARPAVAGCRLASGSSHPFGEASPRPPRSPRGHRLYPGAETRSHAQRRATRRVSNGVQGSFAGRRSLSNASSASEPSNRTTFNTGRNTGRVGDCVGLSPAAARCHLSQSFSVKTSASASSRCAAVNTASTSVGR